MSNEEVIQQFESGAITNGEFHHADHVRVAFAYLSRYPVLEGLHKFSNVLKRIAVASGKPHLYHETITQAYFFLIRERMVRTESATWEQFVCRNRDVLTWKDGVLQKYYHEGTLRSNLARSLFILPDRGL